MRPATLPSSSLTDLACPRVCSRAAVGCAGGLPGGRGGPPRSGARAVVCASTPACSARTTRICASIISWSNVPGVSSTSAGSIWTSRWWRWHRRVMGSVPPVLRPKCRRCARGNPKAPWATAPRFAALAVRGRLAVHRAPTAAHTGMAVWCSRRSGRQPAHGMRRVAA